ncbi:MAG TPA: hypothetical protein VIU62_09205 [Chloroflexota bacterium]
MARLFRYKVDEAGLIDGIFQFVTEPRASVRNALPIVQELREGPNFLLPWDLVENMVLDGVDQREFVADWVHYAVGSLD